MPQASKTSNIQKISAKIIRTGAVDKYAGKHSAEVVVDRSKLPISMQNISPPPESISTSSSTTRHTHYPNDDLEKNDFEYNFGVKSTARRNISLESQSPTKQFYQYGSAGFDLYGMRDDETELNVNDEEEEEEIISNDSSVSEMTNPTFFSQHESMLISRSSALASTGPTSEKIERGPTPSESESSVDQSESATPLIGGGNLSASQSSQEKSADRVTGDDEHSDCDSERSDTILTFSTADWNQRQQQSDKRVSSDGFIEYSQKYSLTDVDDNVSTTNDLFADPPLDCVEDDSDSEPSSKSLSITRLSAPLERETVYDDMDENYIHLTVAAIRSARRQTKIEYDVKVKAIDVESNMIRRESSPNINIPKENNMNETVHDIYPTRSRPKVLKDVDRMNIAELCSSGSIRHTPHVRDLQSSKGKRDMGAYIPWHESRQLHNTENNHLNNIYVPPDVSTNLIIKPFDEGELDDELCEIDSKRSFDHLGGPLLRTGRSSKPDQINKSQAITDRSITPIMSSRRNLVADLTSSSLNSNQSYQGSSDTRRQSDSPISTGYVSPFLYEI